MRSRLLLLPVAIVAGAAMVRPATAVAEDMLNVVGAQAAMFPGATMTPCDLKLTDDQVDLLERESHATVFHATVKLWKVSTGGWFFLDQVPGRDDRITYAVGLDQSGAVKGIEILVCFEGYCDIRVPAWRAQFIGQQTGNGDLSTRIHLISGNTLSSAHVTEGVSRLLTTYALFIKTPAP